MGGGYHNSANYAPFLQRTIYVFSQFFPWGLAHALALPLALTKLYRVFVGSPRGARGADATPLGPRGADATPLARSDVQALLAGFYIGWLVQGNFIQYQWDYHAVPPVLLALTFIVGEAWERVRSLHFAGGSWWSIRSSLGSVILRPAVGWVILAGLVGLVVARQPLLYPKRLSLWGRCWSEGSTGEIQDQLTCFGSPDFASQQWWQFMSIGPIGWADLERLEGYLRAQGVRDGDVAVWSPIGAIALYPDLDVRPPHRVQMLCSFLDIFQSEVPRVLRELEAGHLRYMVSLPDDCPNPWADDWPVVFQSGTLVVRGSPDPPMPDSGGGEGSLDNVNGEAIAGWAWDKNQPASSIQVDIYDGPALLATVPAIHFRKDLAEAGIGNGRHAFSFAPPPSVKDGNVHSISVKTAGTNKELDGCPKTVALNPSVADAYQQSVSQIREVVRTALPPGARVLVVSKGDDDLLKLEGRSGWHFPQNKDGSYLGYNPADSPVAVAHLEQLRAKGAQFLLFPEPAFWWLDHYKELKQHLEARYRRIHSDDHCIIYQLADQQRQSASHEDG
jgi:hypothetical protein